MKNKKKAKKEKDVILLIHDEGGATTSGSHAGGVGVGLDSGFHFLTSFSPVWGSYTASYINVSNTSSHEHPLSVVFGEKKEEKNSSSSRSVGRSREDPEACSSRSLRPQ